MKETQTDRDRLDVAHDRNDLAGKRHDVRPVHFHALADSLRLCDSSAVLHLKWCQCVVQISDGIVLGGARGRSRTDTLLRAADFLPTSAFAALLETSQVRGLEHAFTMAVWP